MHLGKSRLISCDCFAFPVPDFLHLAFLVALSPFCVLFMDCPFVLRGVPNFAQNLLFVGAKLVFGLVGCGDKQAASDDVGTLRSSSSQTSLGYESLRSSPEGGGTVRGPGSATGSVSPTQTYQSRPGSATNTPRFASWSRQQIYGLLSLREIWQQQQHEGPDQQEKYAQLLAAQRKYSDATTNCSSPPPDSAAECSSWPPPFLVKLSSSPGN
jgi:hypothetical protein